MLNGYLLGIFYIWINAFTVTSDVTDVNITDIADVYFTEDSTRTVASVSLNHSQTDKDINVTVATDTPFTNNTEFIFQPNITDAGKEVNVTGSPDICSRYGLPEDQNCIVVQEFANVTLWCNVTTRYSLVMWYFNEDEDKDTPIGIYGEALKIYYVERMCGGQYKCIVQYTDNTNTSERIRVIVTYPPRIAIIASDLGKAQLIDQGDDGALLKRGMGIVLECKISVVPSPYYAAWQINLKPLCIWNETIEYEIRTQVKYYEYYICKYNKDNQIYRLEIKLVEDEQFANYTCVTSSAIGSEVRTYIINENIDAMESSGDYVSDDDSTY